MRRLIVLALLCSLSACAYDPGPIRPGVSGITGITGPSGASTPELSAPTGPSGTTPTFTAEGCPVDDPAFCERATFLANALVLGDADAVLRLFRSDRFDCRDLDATEFPQCAEDPRQEGKGSRVRTYQGETYVLPPDELAETLAFFVDSVDPEYEDELGDSAMRILGVSTCGTGADRTYHLVYLVGLNDPESTLPGDRFLGTYGFERAGGEWAIGTTLVGLYTDWQLALDDPLAEIACGDIAPWGA